MSKIINKARCIKDTLEGIKLPVTKEKEYTLKADYSRMVHFFNDDNGNESEIDMYKYDKIFEFISSDSPQEPYDRSKHYKQKVEPIDLIEAFELGFNRGNVIKYVARAGRKDDELEDLKKASWYLQREIKNLEDGE